MNEMLREIDNFYLGQKEPTKSCLLALKEIILAYHNSLGALWKYKLPCFMFEGRIFCYLWIDKKLNLPYIAIMNTKIEHPQLVQGNRTASKILHIDPQKDIDIKLIYSLFDQAMPKPNVK